MARQPRFILPGYPQHVIQRGNNRHVIYVDDADYRFYKEKLLDACQRFSCRIHAYVLMTNHVHLLMTPDIEAGIGKVMQSLGRCYVQYFNRRYCRTGTLWEGRYKAALLDSDAYLFTCYRYIELNPVRAGMVLNPGDYCWSSYRCNAMGHRDSLVSPHELYIQLGSMETERHERYRAIFHQSPDDHKIEALRDATNKAWVLGSERFRLEIEHLLHRQVLPKTRGGDRKSLEYCDKIDLSEK